MGNKAADRLAPRCQRNRDARDMVFLRRAVRTGINPQLAVPVIDAVAQNAAVGLFVALQPENRTIMGAVSDSMIWGSFATR
jgi:hypothetical protein